MKWSLFLFLFFSFVQAYSQNLISNGNFESYHLPMNWWPQKIYTDSVDNWGDFGEIELHLHNYCGGKAFSGESYIGLKLFSRHVKNYREYAEAKITCPLIKGEKYVVRYRTLPIKGKYLIGNIGVSLTALPIDISAKKVLNILPTFLSRPNKIIDNSIDYTLIEDTITAIGGEQYITIGNFATDKNTPIISSNYDTIYKYYSATYAFDDVELIPLNPNECPEARVQQLSLKSASIGFDTIFSLTNINFATNSADPIGECGGVLKIVQMLLVKDSSLAVKISGYTDLTGANDYNYNLSLKRAVAIGELLNTVGIDCRRIYLSGYGASSPIIDTKQENLANRRVEMNIAPNEKLKLSHAKTLCQ